MAHFSHFYPEGGSIYMIFVMLGYKGQEAIDQYKTAWRVSLRVLFKQGLYVGVIADHELEQACLVHPGAFLYVVGTLQERQKGEKLFLDVYPRGWRVVEVGGDDGGVSTEWKMGSRGRKNKKEKKAT